MRRQISNSSHANVNTARSSKARGNKKTEEKMPQLENDMISLAEPESQIDPKFQTVFKYTRITAKAMREALITKKGWQTTELPCEKTIGTILNRLGFRLRRVQKAKPLKKVAETDALLTSFMLSNMASVSETFLKRFRILLMDFS
ncbi:MAG: hypothetical protein WCG16_11165 [Methylococcales bacterium]